MDLSRRKFLRNAAGLMVPASGILSPSLLLARDRRVPILPASGGIAFRSQGVGSFSINPSPVVTAPSGMAAGDLIVITFGENNDLGASVSNGFTLQGAVATADGAMSTITKIATAGDVSAGSWTFTDYYSINNDGTWAAALYTGVDQTTPMDVTPVTGVFTPTGGGAPFTWDTANITPTNNDSMLVCTLGTDPAATQTATSDGDWTERSDTRNDNLGWSYITEKLQTTAAAEDAGGTCQENREIGIVLMALRKA